WPFDALARQRPAGATRRRKALARRVKHVLLSPPKRMILDRFRLKDKVAIVTGASAGIGRGAALALAEVGANVVCAARTQDRLDRVAAQVRERGTRALAVPC